MDLLLNLGARVRATRLRRGWSQTDLAKRSGLSVRFVTDLENGKGNISVLRLAEVADALSIPIVSLFQEMRPHLALVGLRGAGKSTIGRLLADRLNLSFVEVDTAVEERAGMRLGEIFEYHGATHYRKLEREVLEDLLAVEEGRVLATGGSVVTDPDTWKELRLRARTVWLTASPQGHLARVEAQGDSRPMRGRKDSLAELRQILSVREPLYAQADRQVDTEKLGIDGAVEEIVGWWRG